MQVHANDKVAIHRKLFIFLLFWNKIQFRKHAFKFSDTEVLNLCDKLYHRLFDPQGDLAPRELICIYTSAIGVEFS